MAEMNSGALRRLTRFIERGWMRPAHGISARGRGRTGQVGEQSRDAVEREAVRRLTRLDVDGGLV